MLGLVGAQVYSLVSVSDCIKLYICIRLYISIQSGFILASKLLLGLVCGIREKPAFGISKVTFVLGLGGVSEWGNVTSLLWGFLLCA